jgi:hypothetical protein
MNEFSTMSPIFGVFFALAGLALAVILGMVVYKDERPEPASTKKPLEIQEEGKSA